MSRLILWRHGRTRWNHTRRVQGQTNIELDEVGRAQAAEAAPRLAAFAPDVIITSDLRRAADTADTLGAVTGVPVEVDVRLRERHYGPWQGLDDTEIQARNPVEFERWGKVEPIGVPDIETVEDMAKRVTEVMREAADRIGPAGTAVLVTHGGAARVGIYGFLGWPLEQQFALAVLGNCHHAELTYSRPRGWQLRAYNVA